jgi:hypothetical protein
MFIDLRPPAMPTPASFTREGHIGLLCIDNRPPR